MSFNNKSPDNTEGDPQKSAPVLMLRKKPNAVLLADPSLSFLESLWVDREAQQVPPIFVQTAKEAQIVLAQYKEGFSGIFINPSLSKPGGLAVIRAAHHYQPAVPIFLLVDELEEVDLSVFTEENLKELGIQKIIKKPVSYAEILKLVTPPVNIFDPSDALQIAKKNEDPLETEITAKDNLFFSVRVDNFLSGTKIFFDVYIKLANSRYIKVLRAGDQFSLDRIKNYVKKGVVHFYMRKEAQEAYVNFCDKLVLAILKSPKIPNRIKITQTLHHGQGTMEFLLSHGINQTSLEYASGFVGNVEHLVKQLNLAHYETLRPFLNDIASYDHGVSISIITSLITRHLGIEHEKSVHTCGLASLLHDIGLYNCPENVRHEDLYKMNESEQKMFRKHPVLGAEVLQNVTGLDPVICQIVEQHHERRNRSGFPRQLGSSAILQFSEIVGISDELVKLIYQNREDPNVQPFIEMTNHFDGFSGSVVNAFRLVFGLGAQVNSSVRAA